MSQFPHHLHLAREMAPAICEGLKQWQTLETGKHISQGWQIKNDYLCQHLRVAQNTEWHWSWFPWVFLDCATTFYYVGFTESYVVYPARIYQKNSCIGCMCITQIYIYCPAVTSSGQSSFDGSKGGSQMTWYNGDCTWMAGRAWICLTRHVSWAAQRFAYILPAWTRVFN